MNTETETPKAEPTPEPSAPTSNGSYVFFQKILATMPFFVNREIVKFNPLANNMGVLKLSVDDPLVAPLKIAAEQKRGGIVLIDEPIFEELKKKLPYDPLAQKSKKHVLQAFQMRPPKKPARPAENAADTNRIAGRAAGVGSSGNQGTGIGAGTPVPVPIPISSPPPGEFKPAMARKGFKMPVLKKTTSRSLEGGTPLPD